MSQRPEEPNEASREARAEAVFADYLARLDAGEDVELEALCDENPSLDDLLREHFGRMAAEPVLRTAVPTDAPTNPLPPEAPSRIERERIGRFKVLRVLGSGGMGRVFLARDERLGRDVAVKLMRQAASRDEVSRQRFAREAQAVSRLAHPNIASLYEIGTYEGEEFIVFEYVPGTSLSRRVQDSSFPIGDLLDVALPIARGMEHAHRHGVIHRDLKPSNVVISDEGIPKVLDFGLAKFLPGRLSDERPTLTAEGAVIGSVGYMSPEQAGGTAVDARTDVFSFGCVVYEMATGSPAFVGRNTPQVLHALVVKEPIPLRERAPSHPVELERLVADLLQKEPGRRPQSFGEVVERLDEMRTRSRENVRARALVRAGFDALRRAIRPKR